MTTSAMVHDQDGRRLSDADVDSREPIARLLGDLGSRRSGLSSREAGRRLVRFGSNELRARQARTWPKALAKQFTHPLALLLLLAAALAVVAGTPNLAWAIVAVVLLNALFAFVQENQAGRAVEALGRYLPPHARRPGSRRSRRCRRRRRPRPLRARGAPVRGRHR